MTDFSPHRPFDGISRVPSPAPRRQATGFRVAGGSIPSVHTRGELEEQLRLRLRAMNMIWASATAVLGITAVFAHWTELKQNPVNLFTKPPLPGVLFLITIGAAIFIRMLAPDRHVPLARLRVIEWVGVFITVAFFGTNQIVDLNTGMLNHVLRAPMNLGAGLGAPWGMIVVGYGVLLPASARHAIARTAFIVGCAFVPELVTLPRTVGFATGIPSYLAIKVIVVASMAALAIYGAYRIEVLRQASDQARQLGQYVLRSRLGEGGMGEVYLAEHQFLRRPCAVKLIRSEHAGNDATLARFEREVQVAARLTHPNTIQIFDYGRADDGTFYYAMEYLPGISLEQLVEKHGPQPVGRAVHILTQLCGALAEAHGAGLVHRDLKPGNVMLCERGGLHDVVKLLDYGLVADSHGGDIDTRLTQTGMIVGTPAFMSPEQCAAEGDITPASDIYSIGALAYYLLTGKSPFGSRTAMQMMAAHLYEAPPQVADVRNDAPLALTAIVARCLQKKPADRFAHVQDIEVALRAATSTSWSNTDAREWWKTRERDTTPLDAQPLPAGV